MPVRWIPVFMLAAGWAPAGVNAQDAGRESCRDFPWDTSAIIAALDDAPESDAAGRSADDELPQLAVGDAAELTLAPQADVLFAIVPGRQSDDRTSQAGLARFRVPQAGRYLVAITSAHWIDLIDDGAVLESTGHHGVRDCSRPRKVVEFELPAGRDLLLQLSGHSDATVGLVIVPALAAETG